MPKVNFTKTGTGSITYDYEDWLAGMDTTSAGVDFGMTGGNPFMSEVDPLRSYGYISPTFNPLDVTNIASITSILRKAVIKGDNAYIISGGSTVQKMGTLAGGVISVTAPFPHTIVHGAHTSIVGNDIVNYYTGTTLKAFYSFSDATDWDIGAYNYGADSFDDDFMSTVPATPLGAPYITEGAGFPHPLVQGDDDVMYIGDRNFVHAYDRSTDKFYPAVLTLPLGWIITCFTTTPNLTLAIGAYFTTGQGTGSAFNRGMAKVWFWNYLALDPDYARDLRDNYVSEILPWAGTIAAFTTGRYTLSDRGAYKLQALNGNQFEVVKTWSAGGLPIRGGVDNVGDDLYWQGAGDVYSYTRRPDNGKYILNNLYEQGNTAGMLQFFTATRTIHASFGSGVGSGLIYFNGSTYSDAGFVYPKTVTPDFPVLQQGRLTGITIKFQNTFSGGRSMSLNTRLDSSINVSITNFIGSTTNRIFQISTQSDGSPLGTFNSLQAQVVWRDGSGASSCPVLESIRYEFELINVPQTTITPG